MRLRPKTISSALPFLLAMPLLLGSLPSRAAEAPYEIQVISALSGGGAFIGNAEGKGLRTYEKAINAAGGIAGHPLKFVFHDDQTNPQVAVQLATEIMAQHPAVVFVSSVVASCNATMPLFQNNGPVMYCFAPGIRPRPGSYVYSGDTSTLDLTTASVRYFRLSGVRRLAVLTSTDASGQDAARAIKDVMALPENHDVKLVEQDSFNITDVTVAAQLERIKAAKPQLLIAWSTGAPIGTVFRGIQQEGLDVPVETTDGNMTYAQMTQYKAFLPKQLYIHSAPWMVENDKRVDLPEAVRQKQREFYAAMQAAGIKPDVAVVLGWEPANLIASALQKLGTGATAKQLNDYLQHLQGFAGVNGIYDFVKSPQRGLSIDNAIVTRWEPQVQKWVPVSQLGGVPLKQ